MNPNVAIELGYALRRQTQYNVLMVLNSHYGGRKFLPFDLIHKSGPIIYELAPYASKEEGERVFAELKGSLIAALRPYIKAPTPPAAPRPSFIAARSTASAAVYFEPYEILAAFGIASDNCIVSIPTAQGSIFGFSRSRRESNPSTLRRPTMRLCEQILPGAPRADARSGRTSTSKHIGRRYRRAC